MVVCLPLRSERRVLLQHRQRRFQAVGQIRQGGAILGVALALVAHQNVQIARQPAQLAGRVLIQLIALAVLQLAHLIDQRLDRPQAPVGRQPQQRHHQQQVGQQHVAEPLPHHVGALQLLRNAVDHHDGQRRQARRGGIGVDRHRVSQRVLIGIVIILQLILRFGVVPSTSLLMRVSVSIS